MPPQFLQLPSDLRLLGSVFVLCLIFLLASGSNRCLSVLLTSLSAYALIRHKIDLDGSAHRDYLLGSSWAFTLVYSSHLTLLNDAQLHFRYNGQKEPASKLPVLQRLRWAANLLFNARGVNWNCEIPALRRSKLPKWAFVRSRIGSAILSFLVLDGLQYHAAGNPAFRAGSGVMMGSAGFFTQMWNVIIHWLTVATGLQCLHSLTAAAAVAVGWSSVDDWPAWFGPLRNTTSVRKFWGQTWHQSLRQQLSSHGKYVTRRFNFPQGSPASAYTQLYIAFFLSGICHSAGDWVVRHSINGVKRNMTFFMLQAVAITFEDMIIAGQKRLGVGSGIGKHSLLSHVWVLLWFTWSTPIWFETLVFSIAPPSSLLIGSLVGIPLPAF